MKVKFLMNWEGVERGEVKEIEDAQAADLLSDGVVERYSESNSKVVESEFIALAPVKPAAKKAK